MVTGRASIALLYAVLFVINTGEVVFRSASQAMMPAVVPRERLERANGWLIGGMTLMQEMVAGPLGGFLFVLAASIPFFVNAGTVRGQRDPDRDWSPGKVPGAAGPRPPGGRDGEAGRARRLRADMGEGFRWLTRQRLLRTMAVLIGLLNLTLTAATAVLVLLARERLHLGSVGYGALFTCMAVGGMLGSACGDRLIERVSATWTIRVGLLIEAGMHLTLATAGSAGLVGFVLFAFGVHGCAVDHRGQLAAATADAA